MCWSFGPIIPAAAGADNALIRPSMRRVCSIGRRYSRCPNRILAAARSSSPSMLRLRVPRPNPGSHHHLVVSLARVTCSSVSLSVRRRLVSPVVQPLANRGLQRPLSSVSTSPIVKASPPVSHASRLNPGHIIVSSSCR